MEGLRYLMQDIVMHARIPTAALVNSNSQEMFWLRKIRTLHENGRRNIFHDAGALQEFAQSHPVCLCLVFTHDHIPSSKGTICLYLQYPLQPIQSDLLIRFEETITIHDYPNRRHWQLDYDERYHDLVSRCFTPSTHSFSIFQQETDFLSVHGVSDVQHLCIRENHSINRVDRSLTAKIGIDENGNPVRDAKGNIKMEGKRIFRKAPLHHHFQLCGWSEKKIVLVFAGITVLMCILSYFGVAPRYL